jgi:EmrB/QacA subfamily drug resistance transporter
VEATSSELVRFGTPKGRWVLAVTVLGSGIAFLEATVVNVAVPEIGRDLGATTGDLQWILNGYLLTLSAFILLGGSLGDRMGRRLIFNVGIVWFTLASALCALAPSSEFLIAARVLQGVGGALLTPGSLAIIEATFYPEDRARAIGAWSGLGGAAAAIGPLLGGYLVDAVSWRWIFLINLPLGAFVVFMSNRHVPETRDPTATGKLDIPGAVLAATGLAAATFALISASEGRSTATVAVTAVLGALLLIAFLVNERRSANPMMPLTIFESKQFTAANLVTFCVYAALSGVFFLLVAFLQITMGYSAIAAGSAALPVTVIMLLFSSRAGALATRIGPKWPLTIGPIGIAAGMLMMLRIDPGDSYLSTVFPAVMVYGAGLTLVVAPVTATVLAAADDRHAGVASGINNAVARVAGLIAVAVLPLIAGLSGAAFYDAEAMDDGFKIAMVVTACLSLVGGLIAFLMIDSEVLELEDPEHDCDRAATDRNCGVAGTPLRPGRHVGEEAAPEPVAVSEPSR